MPRKRIRREKNEDLVIVERNLKEIENKPPSKQPKRRRLLRLSAMHEKSENDIFE